jgi:hypothetical protein
MKKSYPFIVSQFLIIFGVIAFNFDWLQTGWMLFILAMAFSFYGFMKLVL